MVTQAELSQINRRGWGLPAPAPSGLWATVADSPAVLAVGDALADWLSNARPLDADAPVSVRRFVEAANQPLENLRAELAMFGFPFGEYLGEVFERRVGANTTCSTSRGATRRPCWWSSWRPTRSSGTSCPGR